MRFFVRIPTQNPKVAITARVEANSWREALRLALEEFGKDTSVLDRAESHSRPDGRVSVEDPDTLRLYEIRPVDAPPGTKEPITTRSVAKRAPAPAATQPKEEKPAPRSPSPDPSTAPSKQQELLPGTVSRPHPSTPGFAASTVADTGPKTAGAAPTDDLAGRPPSVIVNIDSDSELQDETRIPTVPGEPLPILVIGDVNPSTGGPEGSTVPSQKRSETPAQELSNTSAPAEPASPSHVPTQILKTSEIQQTPRDEIPSQSPYESAQGMGANTQYRDLRKGRSLEIVAGALLRVVRTHVPAAAGVVLVPDGKKRHVIVAAAFGLPKSFKVRRFKYGDGVGGFCTEFETAIHVDDLNLRPDLIGEFEEVFTRVQSVISAPVRIRGRTLGAVELIRTEVPPFSQEEYIGLQEICEEQALRIG